MIKKIYGNTYLIIDKYQSLKIFADIGIGLSDDILEEIGEDMNV